MWFFFPPLRYWVASSRGLWLYWFCSDKIGCWSMNTHKTWYAPVNSKWQDDVLCHQQLMLWHGYGYGLVRFREISWFRLVVLLVGHGKHCGLGYNYYFLKPGGASSWLKFEGMIQPSTMTSSLQYNSLIPSLLLIITTVLTSVSCI